MTVRTVLGGFCALLMMVTSVSAQPDSLWSRTFGGSSSDICYSVQQTTDGGYILGGETDSYGAGASDSWLVKVDTDGDSPWGHTFGGYHYDHCYSVQQTEDSGFVLGGNTQSYGAGSSDFWLVKTDVSGTEQWSRTFGGSYWDQCNFVQQTTDDGYILGGDTYSYGAGAYDFWLVKTDGSGLEEWSHTFGGSSSEYCYSIQQTTDGGYILGGSTRSFGAGNSDIWLVKTDVDGDSVWSRTFGGSGTESCYSVQQTIDGGYILGGQESGGDFWLIKTDMNGDSMWSRTIGGSGIDVCYSVQQTLDGGYILGGRTSFGAGQWDFWLVRVDVNGDSLWSRAFGGSGTDYCYSVQQTTDGGYILGGSTNSFGAGGTDFWLVKTDRDPVAADPMLNPLPDKYALHQNYPNPFNPFTQISFDLTKANHVSLKVFDLLGREVTILVDETHPIGTHRATFDGSGLPSGIYFYHLQAGDFAMTKKMVLMK